MQMLMTPRRLLRKTWVGHHAPNTHYAGTRNPMTVVGTATTTVTTTEKIATGGSIIAVITKASAPVKMTMRSTWLRNLLVVVTIKKITTKL
jgi:hypothetical protein